MLTSPNREKVIKLMGEYQIPEVIEKFLGACGLHESLKVETFFSPNIYQLHNPFFHYYFVRVLTGPHGPFSDNHSRTVPE